LDISGSEPLQATLESEKRRRQTLNVPFYTSSTLVTLLRNLRCRARPPDFAINLKLKSKPQKTNGLGLFEWFDRNEFNAAREAARNLGALRIDERLLLLAILKLESQTSKWLKNQLGAKYPTLLDYIEAPRAPAFGNTPSIAYEVPRHTPNPFSKR
jgi:hypothetical protein